MSDATKSGDAPAKVRAPRKAKGTAEKVAAPKLPLTLPKPTTSNGSANATLSGTVEKKFSRIVLRNKAGADIVVIHSTKEGEKALNPGAATVNYIYALVDSVLAGQGAGPDGSAMYAADNWNAFIQYHGEHVKTHTLVCEPAGRAGAQGYIGTLEEFYNQAVLKAKLVRQSIKAFGVAKPHIRTKENKPEVIEVRL
jgi:hypothetical protein